MLIFKSIVIFWLMNMQHIVTGIVKSSSDKIEISSLSLGSSEFISLTIREIDDTVFVGAVNYIYAFSSDLNLLTFVRTDQLIEPVNYNKILLFNDVTKELITCGAFNTQLICSSYDKSTLSEKFALQKIGKSVNISEHNGNALVVAFIGKNRQEKIDEVLFKLYIAISTDSTGNQPTLAITSLNPGRRFYIDHENDLKHSGTFDEYLKKCRVEYVHGFNSGKYNYFLTRQRTSEGRLFQYTSKMIRICNDGINFWHGYIEIPIECKFQGDRPYNLVQAAHVGKPGTELMRSLKIGPDEEVLFVLFSQSEDKTMTSNKPSDQSALCIYSLKEINKKFNDNLQECFNGNKYAGYVLKPGHSTCIKIDETVSWDFCSFATNMPLAGNTSITQSPAITFHNIYPTAIVSKVNGKFNDVFIGTNTGGVKKLVVTDAGACEYVDLPIDEGSPVKSALLLSSKKDHLYIMKKQHLTRIHIPEITDSCSKYKNYDTCIQNTSEKCGWCTLTGTCTIQCNCVLGRMSIWYPNDIRNVLKIELQGSYWVPIGAGTTDRIRFKIPHSPLFNNVFNCSFTILNTVFHTPAKVEATAAMTFNASCPIPLPEQILNVPLNTVFFNSIFSIDTENIKGIGKIDILLYDCNKYFRKECCDNSPFGCRWYVTQEKCLPNWINVANSSAIMPKRWICGNTMSTKKYEKTSSTPPRKTISQTPALRSSVTSRIPITTRALTHKCKDMAHNCITCVTLNEKYNCGWCWSTKTCKCHGSCTEALINHNNQCPSITYFSPEVGPIGGGFNITITGINLGFKFEDIGQSVKVAGIPCEPNRNMYVPQKSITCVVNKFISSPEEEGPIEVEVNGELIKSSQRFKFVIPNIVNIDPKVGFIQGGTMLTIQGKYLNAGSSVQVSIGDTLCPVISRNSSEIKCVTESSNRVKRAVVALNYNGSIPNVTSTNNTFSFIEDPDRDKNGFNYIPKGILAGGIKMLVNNSNPSSSELWFQVNDGNQIYNSSCDIFNDSSTSWICLSPFISNINSDSIIGKSPREMNASLTQSKFRSANLLPTGQQTFFLYPNPEFNHFVTLPVEFGEDRYVIIVGNNINNACQIHDIKVSIWTHSCEVKSISLNHVICCLPKYSSINSSNDPLKNDILEYLNDITVTIGNNFTRTIPKRSINPYSPKSENWNVNYIIFYGLLIVIIVLASIALHCIFCKNMKDRSVKKLKKTRQQMTKLELRVASECKEAFAELQIQATTFLGDQLHTNLPFLNYHSYAINILFPNHNNHAIFQRGNSILTHNKEGLQLFEDLIMNKRFLLLFVKTLENEEHFSMSDRVNVSSMIMITLQKNMGYCTDILITLLGELVEKYMKGKCHPKLLFRKTESVVEKMLSAWFSFLLYTFLEKSSGKPLFNLFHVIKEQTSRGPVDAITSQARYCLSENKILRKKIEYCTSTIYVNISKQTAKIIGLKSAIKEVPVQALDCDTISQFKERSLDAIMNSSLDLNPSELLVEWLSDTCSRKILSDVDSSSKIEGEWRQLNTLKHYRIPNGCVLNLISDKEMNMNISLENTIKLQNNIKYKSTTPLCKTQKINSTESAALIQINDSHYKEWHLIKPYNPVENEDDQNSNDQMIPEVYLTRLLATKSSLQKYVDELFYTIFEIQNQQDCFPMAIKYIFDFLDNQAYRHGVSDPEVVHIWKNNCLPLRFWVNLIKNPNFLFNIRKSNIVDSCLSVIAQVFMDSCSISEQHLNKDSATTKLLYAKEIPTYNELVKKYYEDIKNMPEISSKDMNVLLAEEFKAYVTDFDTKRSVHELFKYATKYKEKLINALKSDESSKDNLLLLKLERVMNIMSSVSNH